MANCIPVAIPNWVLQDERRSAEIKVFESPRKSYLMTGMFFIVVHGGA
jgi:hypothetical protein